MQRHGVVAAVFALCVLSGCEGVWGGGGDFVALDRSDFSGKMADCSRYPARC